MHTILATGRKSGIGPSGVTMTASTAVAQNGIMIRCPDTNTDFVYVGNSGITADSSDVTDGFPVGSGEAIVMPFRHPSELWVRTKTDSNQKLWWILQ